jgi:hypothetical protein
MNEGNRLDLKHEMIFKALDCDEFNKAQSKAVSYPEGFHEVLTAAGEKLGYGFFCSRCKLHIPGRAPKVVKHCGRESKLPELPDGLVQWLKFFFTLKTLKLEQHRLPRRYKF